MKITKINARLLIIALMIMPGIVNAAANIFSHDKSMKVMLSLAGLIVSIVVVILLIANEARKE